jgi:negative regulator of flagellin synthesis FlgM
MRINHYNSIQSNPYKKQTSDLQHEKSQQLYKKDEIQISDEAKKLLSSSKFEQDRAEKVSEIKSRIKNGTYQIDSSKTAQTILNFWREF